jgi:hypothetical protein
VAHDLRGDAIDFASPLSLARSWYGFLEFDQFLQTNTSKQPWSFKTARKSAVILDGTTANPWLSTRKVLETGIAALRGAFMKANYVPAGALVNRIDTGRKL